MTQSFDTVYRAFEDRFRGSPELIKERLRVYLPLLEQLPADTAAPRRAIDLGCGRGEWLEVVSEAGFEPVGVDLNDGMAQAALERGFSVEIGDAIEFMRRQEAASARVVSAFHLAEHLPTEKLLDLLAECHRVLAEGGLLILETPNPENISVGTWTFYIDPTHQKPLPPTLLEFLVQQAGFGQTAILRLNGDDVDERAGAMEQALQTMFDTARDYACLALKQSDEADRGDILSPFVAAATQPNPADRDLLNDAVRRTEAEIRALHEKNAQQIGAVMDELREARRREMASRDEVVAAYRADLDRLGRDMENAATAHAQQIAALQADLSARATAIEAHEAEIERLHGRIADTDTAHAQQIAALQAELAERDAAIAERRAEIDRLHHQIATAEADHARELAVRQTDIAAHDAAVAAHRSEAERVQRAFDAAALEHAGRLTALQADLAAREATIAAQLAEIERLHIHHNDAALVDRLAALQVDLAARDAVIAEHAAELERLRQHAAEVEAAHAQDIAAHRAELASRDEMVAAREAAAAVHAGQIAALQADLAARDEGLAALSQARDLASRHGDELGRQVAALRASTSWRVTAPLRAVSRAIRWLLRGPRWFFGGVWAWITFKPGSRPRRMLRAAFVAIAHFILLRPRLAASAKRLARRLPDGVYSRLRLAIFRPPAASEPAAPPASSPSAAIMSPPGKPDLSQQAIASTIDMNALQRVRMKLGAPE